MQYTVIGGSGFIGSRLCRLLKEAGSDFQIFDKVYSQDFPERVNIGDVRVFENLQDSIVDGSIIINLAAEHRDDVRPASLYEEVNVVGALNICKAANKKGIKTIVFTSTVAVYGFAPVGTDESGAIDPFNEYGRTKYEAEKVFVSWQAEDPGSRVLVIIRPTVVFGEKNRGNVYNLLKQIQSAKFIMVGDGSNRKSLAYVENVASFIAFSTRFKPGVHTFNYVDKPDYDMNELVCKVRRILGKSEKIRFRLPYSLGYAAGKIFDLMSFLTSVRFAISSIRIKKFCANSVYETSIPTTGFVFPVPLDKALIQTIRYEFIESHDHSHLFYSE